MSTIVHLVLLLLALPAIGTCLYLGVLTLLSARLPRPLPSTRDLSFDVLVPAHNEAAVIERTVASLMRLDWPADRFRVIVIADNCNDATAELARSAGAISIERFDETQRGKGYALAYGITRSAQDGFADAVAVVDADTVVSPNLLAAYAARIEQGAEAMQANYGVLNPDDSWRTRIITIAYGAFHAVRSRARERLRVSCGLRGNGMCFTRALLQRHPFRVYSLAEDLEYGIVLGLDGVRVHYVDEANVDAELVTSGQDSASQRQRWEGGRFGILRAYTGRLLYQGLRQPSKVCLDLGFDLLTLPLGYVALEVGLVFVLSLLAAWALPGMTGWIWLSIGLMAILTLYILRGWQLTPLGPRALLDLARAPFFVVWKLGVLLRHRGNKVWIKTRRDKS